MVVSNIGRLTMPVVILIFWNGSLSRLENVPGSVFVNDGYFKTGFCKSVAMSARASYEAL